MTLQQARKRFPLVPVELLSWAVENIPDPADVERALRRLQESRRITLRYGV
jgi:hypothetical protein